MEPRSVISLCVLLHLEYQLWKELPIKDSKDQEKRAEEHQLQDPPVADQIGNTRQDHESKRESWVAQNGAQSKLGGIAPLPTFKHNIMDSSLQRDDLKLLF